MMKIITVLKRLIVRFKNMGVCIGIPGDCLNKGRNILVQIRMDKSNYIKLWTNGINTGDILIFNGVWN